MRSRQLLVMAVVVAAAAACTPGDETAEETTPATETTPPITPEGVTGDMAIASGTFAPTSTAGGTQISGTAEVRRAGTGTTGTPGAGGEPLEVRVSINGLTAEHAWHIHQGACSTEQAPVTVPFTQPLRGTAGTPTEQTAPIPAGQLTQQQLESGQYSVRVHQSSSEGAPTIACADIQRR